MNKKIKVIELFNKIFNGEIPKKVIYKNIIYEYIENQYGEGYLHTNFDNETNCEEIDWLVDDIHWDSVEDLNDEVEILEDNTEEIILTEKIFIPLELQLTDYDKNLINNCFESQNALINQLVRAVNKLRKDKSNDK